MGSISIHLHNLIRLGTHWTRHRHSHLLRLHRTVAVAHSGVVSGCEVQKGAALAVEVGAAVHACERIGYAHRSSVARAGLREVDTLYEGLIKAIGVHAHWKYAVVSVQEV